MQTQDFLRQAANNLRQAVQARKLEIDELRKTITMQDNVDQSMQITQDLSRMRNDLNQEIALKEKNMNDLNQLVQTIERQMTQI